MNGLRAWMSLKPTFKVSDFNEVLLTRTALVVFFGCRLRLFFPDLILSRRRGRCRHGFLPANPGRALSTRNGVIFAGEFVVQWGGLLADGIQALGLGSFSPCFCDGHHFRNASMCILPTT